MEFVGTCYTDTHTTGVRARSRDKCFHVISVFTCVRMDADRFLFWSENCIRVDLRLHPHPHHHLPYGSAWTSVSDRCNEGIVCYHRFVVSGPSFCVTEMLPWRKTKVRTFACFKCPSVTTEPDETGWNEGLPVANFYIVNIWKVPLNVHFPLLDSLRSLSWADLAVPLHSIESVM